MSVIEKQGGKWYVRPDSDFMPKIVGKNSWDQIMVERGRPDIWEADNSIEGPFNSESEAQSWLDDWNTHEGWDD